MPKESSFKIWLGQRGARSVVGRNSHAFAIRMIVAPHVRKLEELGMPFRDLD